MNSNKFRDIKGFDPFDLLELGEGAATVGPSGETIPGKIVQYLPAKARQDWFNQYCLENNKIMPLTTEVVRIDSGLIVIRATLQEVVTINKEQQLITIATGIASQFIGVDTNSSVVEICETRAKARCLGSAGFSLPAEYSIFDEGETPVDGALMNRRLAERVDATTDAKKVEVEEPPVKKKRGRPKKNAVAEQKVTETKQVVPEFNVQPAVERVETVGENLQLEEKSTRQETENSPLEVPSFEKVSNLFSKSGTEGQDDKKDDKIRERDILKQCLRAFFPYGQYKGQQVVDVITQKKFKDTIDKMSLTNYDGQMVNNNLSVNVLIQTLKKYLNLPTSEDRLLLMGLISEMRMEEDENEDCE